MAGAGGESIVASGDLLLLDPSIGVRTDEE